MVRKDTHDFFWSIHWILTLLDLLNSSQNDFVKTKHFHKKDIKYILDILEIEKDFL